MREKANLKTGEALDSVTDWWVGLPEHVLGEKRGQQQFWSELARRPTRHDCFHHLMLFKKALCGREREGGHIGRGVADILTNGVSAVEISQRETKWERESDQPPWPLGT